MKKIPFNTDELIPIGSRYGYTFHNPVPAYATPVSSKENYFTMIQHQLPYWIPQYDDLCTINPRVLVENVVHVAVKAANSLTEEEMTGGADMFGIEWEYIKIAGGSIVKPGNPLLKDAGEWKEKLHFPDIYELNWEEDSKLNQEYLNNDQPKISWIFCGLFERLISFMDFEPAIIALIDEDQMDAVKELFDSLCDLYIEIIGNLKKYYDIDILYFHDDWGSQRAPFFSLETCREMLVPYVKRLTDYCHDIGVLFELHCCGNNELLVPAMIEAGVDLWGGQPNANDYDMLYEKYGDKIILGIAAPIDPDADENTAYQVALAYVNKYAGNYEKKPVYLTGFFPHVKEREFLYLLSRKSFSK